MSKVAIVTGGTRGIGYSVAKQLLDLDYTVYIFGTIDRTEEELQSVKYADFNYMRLNVSDYKFVKESFKCIYEKQGRIDVLVNFAGITRNKKIKFMTEIVWKDVIKVNLDGTFWTVKQTSKYMMKNKGGGIVNISSVVAHKTVIGQINYSSSKAGVETLTRSSALELEKYNIRVNSVSLGCIDTDMLSSLGKIDDIIEVMPLNRLGDVQDVSDFVCFLLSDKAKYITGQNFIIDGGLSL
ncbi:cylG protein [Streptococcus pneumoniae]|uniref:CylG protein n=1 Tax=Streptococcus pneumoniae TaxID=1313 RepID=A0AA86XWE0_STREE|nr:cylG protein [Streptococcus pneumoniae]CIS35680.1 cylG protein [Streptococcus pneumoniae]CIZ01219.1 cylG protein [Streptococcus pneumoniae]CJV32708.1 cylG protein [Streptococcus pneumoniae]CJX03106.1 cylG protein [Streptococcus pneumoniae]